MRADLAAIMGAAIAAADAARLTRAALADADVDHALGCAAAVDVVAAGKAAGPMLTAAAVACSGLPLRQLVAVSHIEPDAGLPAGSRWHTAAHPVPDDRSVAAAADVMEVAGAAAPTDVMLVLLSGGASSMMALPVDGVSLGDKRRTSQQLMNAGADVRALNTVRKHLSAIKGGQLAAASRGWLLTLAISDVVGDDLSAIGSGPTVADATTYGDALDALQTHGGLSAYPRAVVAHLTSGAVGATRETPKPGHPRLSRSHARVIGSSRTAVEGARAAAVSRGYCVHLVDGPVTGAARAAGESLVRAVGGLVEARAPAGPLCLIGAGETTVHVTGGGRGGRNQECALAMAPGLAAMGRSVAAASFGTDGIDGPTDAAGAVVDSTTLTRAAAAGLGPPQQYLDANDSYAFFDRLQDLVVTGPTRTNVGDVQVILVD